MTKKEIIDLLTNFDTEVMNGGFSQWKLNSKPKETDNLLKILIIADSYNIPGCENLYDILTKYRNIGTPSHYVEMEEMITCPDCNGYGTYVPESDDKCESCEGAGEIPITEDEALERANDHVYDLFSELDDDYDLFSENIINHFGEIAEITSKENVEDVPIPSCTIKPVCKLTGTDSNIFALMSRVTAALRSAGLKHEIEAMTNEVTNTSSYHEALHVLGNYVDIR